MITGVQKKAFLRITIVLTFIFYSGCAKKEEFSLYRLIDHLGQENIQRSPLKELVSDSRLFKTNSSLLEIVDRFILEDAGTGENPYNIKKKMEIGLVDINSLLAPPESQFKFPMSIPEKSFLEFTYGIRRDREYLLSRKGERRVRFRIILEVKKRRVELFKKTLSLMPDQALVFNYRKIDLSDYGGMKGTFYFITRGSEKALACWFNPVIYRPSQNGRNIILISLDTLRGDHLSCYGYRRKTSPSMDLLARDSVLFLNTFAPSPWTLPSHISLMTSLNTVNHRVYYNRQKLDSSIMTLADFLRINGFFTAAFTGGGYVSGMYGFNKGFDSYNVRGQIGAEDSAEVLSRAALDWIERNKDRSFFLFLHTYQIHNPYSPPSPFNELFLDEEYVLKKINFDDLRTGRENRFKPLPEKLRRNVVALYDGEIRYTDENLVKPLVEKLKELNLYDRTMIILTSDHGEEFYEHGAWTHTHSVYNEIIKIPLIIKFFNSKYRGKRVKKFARLIDVMPTILDELKIKYSGYFLEGESLLDLVSRDEGKGKGEERIFISDLALNVEGNHIPQKVAINQGPYKLITSGKYTPEDLSYFLFPPQPVEIELYNLEKDPFEKVNIASTKPELARELLELLKVRYRQRRKGSAMETELSDSVRQQLKALGYIE